jgi:hypothetical protein
LQDVAVGHKLRIDGAAKQVKDFSGDQVLRLQLCNLPTAGATRVDAA